MGGSYSRTKGHAYERKIAARLREEFPELADEIQRTIQSRFGGKEGADVIFPGFHFELQHAADPTPLKKLEQAEDDLVYHSSTNRPFPVAITHKTGSRSNQATLRLYVVQLLSGARARPSMLEHEDDDIYDWVGKVQEYDSLLTVPVTIDFEDFLKLVKFHRSRGTTPAPQEPSD